MDPIEPPGHKLYRYEEKTHQRLEGPAREAPQIITEARARRHPIPGHRPHFDRLQPGAPGQVLETIGCKAKIVVRHFVQAPDMRGGEDEVAAGLEHPRHVLDHPPRLGHVFEHLRGKNRFKAPIAKGQIHTAAPHIGRAVGVARAVEFEPDIASEVAGVGPPPAAGIKHPTPGVTHRRLLHAIAVDPLDQPVGGKGTHPR